MQEESIIAFDHYMVRFSGKQTLKCISEEGGLPVDGGNPPSLLSEVKQYHEVQFYLVI